MTRPPRRAEFRSASPGGKLNASPKEARRPALELMRRAETQRPETQRPNTQVICFVTNEPEPRRHGSQRQVRIWSFGQARIVD